MRQPVIKTAKVTHDPLVQYIASVKKLNQHMDRILTCNHDVVRSLTRAASALR